MGWVNKKEKEKESAPQKEKDLAKEEAKEAALSSQEAEIKKKSEECEQLRDNYLRIVAEFDNARKRWERERGEVVKFANFFLLKDFLIILDEMEQALKMANEHKKSEEIAKGLEIMFNNFAANLKKRGLKKIEAEGKIFDPHLHEVVSIRNIDDEQTDSIVLEEVQKGYLFEGKVLRTAKVIVGVKKKPETAASMPKEAEAKAEEAEGNQEPKEQEKTQEELDSQREEKKEEDNSKE